MRKPTGPVLGACAVLLALGMPAVCIAAQAQESSPAPQMPETPRAQTAKPAPRTPAATSPTPAEEARIALKLDDNISEDARIRSPGYYLLRSLISLAIVVALIYGASILLQEMRRRPLVRGHGGDIEIIESTALAPGQTVHLISVRGRLFLLGATQQGIRLLKEITPGQSQNSQDTQDSAAEDSTKT